MNKPPAPAPPAPPAPSRSARPGWRVLLPLCVLLLLVAPGCVAANPFFRVTAGLWELLSGTR